ncbi:beta-lactamase/transpeptidase-like protein [Pelagophyceae sp. CCMP2097]|nr:beta-lactamase/transpeptidase-like protein [Pelagophyceae sp. CCMP2097]
MRFLRLALVLGTAFGGEERRGAKSFGAVKQWLDLTQTNITLTIGDASGVLFEYRSGYMNADVIKPLASGSKWPAATALMATFHAHNVSIDEPLSKYLDWWASSPLDARSKVTLRQVMSMTTGMIVDSDCDISLNDCAERKALGKVGFEAFAGCKGDLPQCAKELYDALPHKPMYAPGEKFMYSSLSFQFAAAVAVAVSGMPIGELLDRFVLGPLKMGPECFWADSDKNPLLGGGLNCNGRQMDKFVHAMLVDELVPRRVREEMETVQVTELSQYSTTTAFWGPYCMGNWLECIHGQYGVVVPQQCVDAGRHGHPGCGGYYDFVHRRAGYYFSMLPSWECTAQNAYCGTGSPDAWGAGCPALYGYATSLRIGIAGFLDDIFGA